jgi:hypothetical protein
MNRIKALYDAAGAEEPVLGDFVVVSGSFGWSRVTHATAHEIERQLARFWVPRWIVFTDCVGSRIRVRANQIQVMAESTATQRAADRRLDRARRLEETADRRPGDDDD